LQHRITEELEPLVGLDSQALLVGDRWVSQRQPKQIEILKTIA